MTNNEQLAETSRQRNTQNSYSEYRLKHYLHNSPYYLVLCVVVNLLLLFPDLNLIQAGEKRLLIIILRTLFSALLIICLFQLNRIRTFRVYRAVITLFELGLYGLFLAVLSQYSSPDFMIQMFGVLTCIIAVFLLPNQWINQIVVAGIMGTSFLACTGIFFPDLDGMHFLTSIVYVLLIGLLCAFSAWKLERSQQREFEAVQELELKNATDHLTHAITRAKLEEEALRWMSFCRAEGFPLSIVFVDVDNLKIINDRYGHLAGDRVLVELVARMHGLMKNSDIVARWGGDEFVLLLPNADTKKSQSICREISQSTSEKPFTGNIDVTCSFGVAEMKQGSTFETILAEADRLMYKSKQLGKNRIECAQ